MLFDAPRRLTAPRAILDRVRQHVHKARIDRRKCAHSILQAAVSCAMIRLWCDSHDEAAGSSWRFAIERATHASPLGWGAR